MLQIYKCYLYKARDSQDLSLLYFNNNITKIETLEPLLLSLLLLLLLLLLLVVVVLVLLLLLLLLLLFYVNCFLFSVILLVFFPLLKSF